MTRLGLLVLVAALGLGPGRGHEVHEELFERVDVILLGEHLHGADPFGVVTTHVVTGLVDVPGRALLTPVAGVAEPDDDAATPAAGCLEGAGRDVVGEAHGGSFPPEGGIKSGG
jgi:hypothetical protein